jgi:hypothetical protein
MTLIVRSENGAWLARPSCSHLAASRGVLRVLDDFHSLLLKGLGKIQGRVDIELYLRMTTQSGAKIAPSVSDLSAFRGTASSASRGGS